MNGGTSPFSVSVYSTTRQAVYVDKTDHVFEAYAGEEIQPVVNWAGEWMHGYLYIDYDKDYTFSYTLGSDDYPRPTASWSPIRFIARVTLSGVRTARAKLRRITADWTMFPPSHCPRVLLRRIPRAFENRLVSLGSLWASRRNPNTLTGNGGNIVDFTLRIVERPATYTVTLPETVENGTLTVMNGSVALVPGANTVEENSELTITAEPAKDTGWNRSPSTAAPSRAEIPIR